MITLVDVAHITLLVYADEWHGRYAHDGYSITNESLHSGRAGSEKSVVSFD